MGRKTEPRRVDESSLMGYLRLYILFLPHVPSLSSSPLPSSSSPQSAYSRPITSHWHCLQRRYRVSRHRRLQPLHLTIPKQNQGPWCQFVYGFPSLDALSLMFQEVDGRSLKCVRLCPTLPPLICSAQTAVYA